MESSSRDSRKRVGLSSSGQSSGWMRRELGDDDGDGDGDDDQTSAYSSAGNKLAIRDLEAAEAVIVLWRRLPVLLRVHPSSCSAPQVYALHVRDRELLLFVLQVADRTADDAAPCAAVLVLVLVLVLDCRADDDQLLAQHVGSALRFAAILLGVMARDTMIRCDMLCCVSRVVGLVDARAGWEAGKVGGWRLERCGTCSGTFSSGRVVSSSSSASSATQACQHIQKQTQDAKNGHSHKS